MKNTMLATALCLILTLICPASATEIVRISSGEYVPWTSKELKHGGFTNHVISEAFRLVDIDVEFTNYPWQRAFHATEPASVMTYDGKAVVARLCMASSKFRLLSESNIIHCSVIATNSGRVLCTGCSNKIHVNSYPQTWHLFT